ncbi:MAG: CRTAC1 family protein [Candidatus Marinimicrobia bacterium]|nr:CRTAC1 family protein [Candidatus Neomarinimicrobiota bacterium]
MANRLSDRRRRIITTSVVIALFVVGATAVVRLSTNRERPYRPGENIEGLTARLSRAIPDDYPRVTFTDATAEAGIEFRHFYGERTTQLPEDIGSGAAWGDYDNDGWLDLFVVNFVGPLTMKADEFIRSPAHSMLYRNNGDGTFEEVSAFAGVDYRGWGMAAAWSDYDNDGWLDLFISAYGENLFYRNNGDGTFEDITGQSGLGGKKGFWTGASWADFDLDGYLDLYVCGYVQYTPRREQGDSYQYDLEIPVSLNPSSFQPERNLLYRNNGDGSFTEVGELAGVHNPGGRSLSAAWCDFDEDGWPDLYVANDVSDNAMFRNLGNGKFEEISLSAWVADYRGAMGLALGDWDGDADMDIFVTHWIAQENALFNNLRSQLPSLGGSISGIKFMDEAERFGLGQIALDYIGWGTSFFDYDADGKLDLYIVNGSTFQQNDQPNLLIPMTDQLFWNRGNEVGYFDVSSVSGDVFKSQHVGRGAAFGDYDNDGDVDIFTVSNGGPGQLLKNDGGHNNWLKVSLRGTRSNRQGVGARLRLVAGGSTQIRQVGAQSSYLSQNSMIEHFGLGSHTAVDTLEIIWPGGAQQELHAIAVNQTLLIVEGQAWEPSPANSP